MNNPFEEPETELVQYSDKFKHCIVYIYMLFAGWEVRIVKNCDRGLENAARGRRPDSKPVNNLFIFFQALK